MSFWSPLCVAAERLADRLLEFLTAFGEVHLERHGMGVLLKQSDSIKPITRQDFSE